MLHYMLHYVLPLWIKYCVVTVNLFIEAGGKFSQINRWEMLVKGVMLTFRINLGS